MKKLLPLLLAFFVALPANAAQWSPFYQRQQFLFPTFEAQPVLNQALTIFSSPDGLTSFKDTGASVSGSADTIRDPTLFNDLSGPSGKLWMFSTNTILGVANTTFDIWSASNGAACVDGSVGCAFVFQQQVSCSNLVSGVNASVWAPKPFVDPNGAANNLAILVSASNTGLADTGFAAAYTSPTDRTGLTTWSNCTYITGTGFPQNIDANIMSQTCGGVYWMWMKDETNKVLDLFTSSSPFTGYVAYGTLNFAGFGNNLESPWPTPLDNSCQRFRIYISGVGATVNYYSETYDQFQSYTPLVLLPGIPWYGGSSFVYRNTPLPSPPAAWTPASLGPALVAWYSAKTGVNLSGANVLGLSDISNHAITLTANAAGAKPQYSSSSCNGNPGITFNGSTSYLNSATGAIGLPVITPRMSFYVAGQMTTGTPAYGRLISTVPNGNSYTDYKNTNSAVPLARNVSTNAFAAFVNSVSATPQSSMAVSLATNYHIGMEFAVPPAATSINVNSLLNEVQQSTSTAAVPGQWGFGSNPYNLTLAIGTDLTTNGAGVVGFGVNSGWWAGIVCEVIITRDALTAADKAQLGAYLTAQWGF